MKKLMSIMSIGMIMLACGCTACSGCKVLGDNKPVAPETYQDGEVQKGDPQLPYQKPWWKF